VPVPPALAGAGASSFPPCIDVAFEAAPVTGQPPLTFSWSSDTGEQLSGNPAVIDTTGYPAGPHQLTVTVTNAAGSAQAAAPFAVEALAAAPPVALENPVAGLQATVEGTASGYNEWRFVWGDGQVTPWQPACVAATSHTYAAAGTYPVRLEARNCREAAMSSDPLLVTVGGINLAVSEFRVLGCQFGPCIFSPGETLTFVQAFTLPPALLYYDWDGDGAADEISGLPIAIHAYDDPGSYRPEITAEWGTAQATRVHAEWIYVSSDPQPIAFYDGFESGDAGCWSSAVGAPPSAADGGCFAPP
ncbi:MAG: PKD domain-containing protein, partial [Gammaproteobacteria bacterium]